GLSAALSVIVRLPVRFPPAAGVNVMLMAQLAPAATLLPQVLVWAKSPLAAMPVIFNAALPVFVRVTDFGVFVPTTCDPKFKLVAERLTSALSPVPVMATVCVLPATALLLSVIVSVPERLPSCVGVNVTLIVQLAPAAIEPPQTLVSEKSPLAVMLVIVRAAAPVLLRVRVWAPLVVPTF